MSVSCDLEHLFYEGVDPFLRQISHPFAKLRFLGHVRMSKLSWDCLLTLCRINLSFELFPLWPICWMNFICTAVERRMMVLAKIKSGPLINLRKALIRHCQHRESMYINNGQLPELRASMFVLPTLHM